VSSEHPRAQLAPVVVPPEPAWEPERFPPAMRGSRLTQTIRLNRDPLGELHRGRQLHGPVFTIRLFPFRGGVVCATDPATNREVLTDSDRFVAGAAAGLIEPLVGSHSLILTPPPKHNRNRKLLMPPFHGSRIARWAEQIRTLVVQQLPALMGGGPVRVRPWAQRLTLDVILQVVFGIDDPARRMVYRRALDRLMDPRMAAILYTPDAVRRDLGPLSPGGALARRRAEVDRLLMEEIAQRRADPTSATRDDVLSVLLGARDEDGLGFTDEELRDELKGLVIAGHETTATSLAWILHLLALNPGARDSLLTDLEIGGAEYLAATIKESMRLQPPVWAAPRIAREDTVLGGRSVPAGAHVLAMFCITQRSADVWQEPTVFRPERHLDGHTDTWASTPFGGGARRCIGAALAQLEIEVVLRALLERAVPEAVGPLEPTRLLGVTLVPAAGGTVRMRTHG
jgi:cytochrome P450